MLKRILTLVLAICMVLPLTGINAAAVTLRDDLSGVTLQKKDADKWTGQRVERLFDRLLKSGISTADVGDQEFEESEPNDSYSQANLIYHDYTVYGTIEGDDLDGYVFELDEYSQVTIISACTTDGLGYGILDVETQDVVAESGYLEYDAESGLHLAGLSVELPAGVYCLVFFDKYESSLEYMFYVDISEAEGHVHDYEVSTVEATCTEDGYVVYTCVCGDSFMGDEIPALGHDFENAPIFPHENGVQHCWDCNRCPERRYANCTFNGVVTKEPTATEEGVKTFTCGICGNSYTESIPVVEEEVNEIASGTCGEAMNWVLTENGVLTIFGTGEMKDYTTKTPWMSYADQITEVVVADGVTDLGDFAFYALTEATKITLPDTLKTIGGGAFCNSGFEEINIPAGVENLEGGMFESCFSLKKINVHKDNASFSSDSQGILYNKNKTVLIYCPQGFAGVCVIPEGVEQISFNAFHYCDKLTAVTIPGTVKTIGQSGFASCYALEKVTLNEGLEKIGQEAFYDCTVLAEITVPATVKMIGEEAFSCSGLKTVRFMGDAPEIAPYAFVLVTATVSYPADNATWTEEVRTDYGGTLTWVAEAGAVESVPRIYGAGRVETSFAVADALKEVLGIDKFSTILIAYGDNFADALAGSYLASAKKAPILLYRPGYEDEILDYVTENLSGGGKIYILGGTAAVPKVMEDTLAGYTVERLAGTTRFETNILILEEVGVTGEEILIATGWNFADSLSASATGLPVLLVNNTTGKLTDSQIAFLQAHADNTYTIIGGKNAVSQDLQTTIESVIGREVCRVYGDWREDTAVAVAETYFDQPDTVLLAFSRNYPDGLCGGPLAYAMGAPLLLINADMEEAAAEYVKVNGIETGFVLGGSAAVSEKSARIVFGLE